MNVIIRLGNWIESLGKPKAYATQAQIDVLYNSITYLSQRVDSLSTLISIIGKRMDVTESSTASRVSVEEALNVLDKKIAALMVANSFPSFSSVPQDDPLQIIARK